MSDLRERKELPFLDVFSEAYARNPYPMIEGARAQGEVVRSERGLEFLSRRAAQELLFDKRFNTGIARILSFQKVHDGPLFSLFAENLLAVEGEHHRRLRGALMPFFNTSSVECMRQVARTHARAWLREVADAGQLDFAEVIGRRLPAAVFCYMIGAPLEDAEHISRISEDLLKIFTFHPGNDQIAARALRQGEHYVRNLIEARRSKPGSDLVSALLSVSGGDRLRDNEIFELVLLVLAGSTDNSKTQLCENMLAFAAHPRSWQMLKQEPELIPSAVLECIRWMPGFLVGIRVANEDLLFRGVSLTADEAVYSNVLAANRDPSIYSNPHTFDIRRTDTLALNFGYGRHSCLGRGIAIVEMEETLRAALDLWSEFEVTGACNIWGSPFSLRTESIPLSFTIDKKARLSS
jgi:cytochrome P450